MSYDTFKNLHIDIKEQIKSALSYLSDVTENLDERWTVFGNLTHHLASDWDSSVAGYDFYNLYNYAERYQTYSYYDIVCELEEELTEFDNHEDALRSISFVRYVKVLGLEFNFNTNLEEFFAEVKIKLDEIKEHVLSEGYGTFKYDW